MILIFCLLFAVQPPDTAEVLSLREAFELAQARYPLTQQAAVNVELTDNRLAQLDLQKLPSLSLNARAAYQSEAISLQLPLPGGEKTVEQSRLNAQATLEAGYSLYDGGLHRAKTKQVQAQSAVEQQQLEAALAPLKSKVSTAFYRVLLARQQDSILAVAQNGLQDQLQVVQAARELGTVLPSEVDKLQIELTRLAARRAQVAGEAKAALASLSALTGRALAENTDLTADDLPPTTFTEAARRPEAEVLSRQKDLLLAGADLLDARARPQVNLFLQTGLGYPNPLNFFETQLSPFAVGGIQLRWTLYDWGLRGRRREELSLQAHQLELRRQALEYDVNLIDGAYREQYAQLYRQLAFDADIIQREADVLERLAARLRLGVATVNDYTRQLNAGIEARLTEALHRLQLEQLRVDYLIQKGWL